MIRAELTYYRLRFPDDLSQEAVLAALASFSGAPYFTRLVFELTATQQGISHWLAVSPKAAETVLGNLRAAIPSLRLDQADPPTHRHNLRALWQVAPSTSVIFARALLCFAARLRERYKKSVIEIGEWGR